MYTYFTHFSCRNSCHAASCYNADPALLTPRPVPPLARAPSRGHEHHACVLRASDPACQRRSSVRQGRRATAARAEIGRAPESNSKWAKKRKSEWCSVRVRKRRFGNRAFWVHEASVWSKSRTERLVRTGSLICQLRNMNLRVAKTRQRKPWQAVCLL
ncbi:hypothetical protein AGIG_G18231 [Arapaima gigas]